LVEDDGMALLRTL